MRQIIDPQLKFGEQDIARIVLDARSRDDIPRVLRGLQHIYVTPAVRTQVFAILAEVLPRSADGQSAVNPDRGRPGMEQWRILVLGVLRLGLNADYDRIRELANQHATLRRMLGHGDWADDTRYGLQTLKDNLRLFTPDILDRINQVVVTAGHALVKKSPNEELNVRADSFVVETNVHYPTDTNLLLDAIRKVIATCAQLCEAQDLSDWRQSAYNQRCFTRAYRRTQQNKHSRAKSADKRAARAQQIEATYRNYPDLAEAFLRRAQVTRSKLSIGCRLPDAFLAPLDDWVAHAERQIEQIRRRVLHGERIPHHEKVFSIFQLHTEWINKGKAGVPVELGLRVAVVEDRYRFILHHQVMEKITDDQVAIALIDATRARFPKLRSISMENGCHSKANQAHLANVVAMPVLPKKGKCNQAEAAHEQNPEFIRLRRRHSAVESAINALEAHGLDRCPDHGIDGFRRYVAFAVLGRNLHRVGAILLEREAEAEQRRRQRAA